MLEYLLRLFTIRKVKSSYTMKITKVDKIVKTKRQAKKYLRKIDKNNNYYVENIYIDEKGNLYKCLTCNHDYTSYSVIY